jgi:hypothetical protein
MPEQVGHDTDFKACAKTTASLISLNDFKCGISRPAKCEKPEHTGVCEDFEHEHNAEITT